MNLTFQGTWFDGETLAARPVTITVNAGRLQGSAETPVFDVSLADVRASDRLSNIPRHLYLPEGRSVETTDNDAVDTLLSGQRRGQLVAIVHALEIRSRVAAVATVLLVASVGATIWWGLPVLALRAAMAVPASVEQQAGKAGLATLARILGPSELKSAGRKRVQAQLDKLVKAGGFKESPKLVFHSMGRRAANAFALPGGIIVVSDELVNLAEPDEEMAAVLAHEIGHWQRRHALQSLLRSSTALLVVSTVTGDLSTLTTFAGTIPFVLLQRGYSREFEAEADQYAVDLLRKAGVKPQYFASILDKLEESRPTEGVDYSYLSTHPSTGDRIRLIDPTYVTGSAVKPPKVKPESKDAFTEFRPKDPVKRENVNQLFKDPPVKLGFMDKQPQALTRRAPNYPTEMRKQSIGGSVTVEFIIDQAGNVHSTRVVRSTRGEFEEPAVTAVKEWKFIPGEKDGRKVSVSASQLLVFDPNEGQAAPSPASAVPLTSEPNPDTVTELPTPPTTHPGK
jgi:TonB family protein